MSALNEKIKDIFFENTEAELIEGWYKTWETDVDKLAGGIEALIKEMVSEAFDAGLLNLNTKEQYLKTLFPE